MPEEATCPRLDALEQDQLQGGFKLAKAESRSSRMRGLARLDSMPSNYGLLIPRCSSVHTFTMRFDLDLIWLDKAGDAIRIDRNVGPRRMRSCRGAKSVVEVNSGEGESFAEAMQAGSR
jgi:uncharacterized membrane protein (UPF0127 family)